MIAVAAVSGAMAVTMPAYAGSAADGTGAGSPGLVSGNVAQLPVHVPVNVCGNTVNVVGLLNPAAGNSCGNEGSGGGVPRGRGSVPEVGGPTAGDGARAEGDTTDSPGVLAGNGVRLPVHLPVNLSGNSVNVVGVGNASVGNESVNEPGHHLDAPAPAVPTEFTPVSPPRHHPGPRPTPVVPSDPGTTLAHTGADHLLPAALTSAGLLLGGATLYRRSRPRPTH
ncbi:chaplin [Streptomyces griseorubiginosus]|uniref:chaplin n=1 Tax=Streptomyces griseorubiginosus TaxID=67304 RepID=UPI0036E46998